MADTITATCKVCEVDFDYLPNAGLEKICDGCLEEYDCDHQCTSGCQKYFDCPCQSDHTCKNTIL